MNRYPVVRHVIHPENIPTLELAMEDDLDIRAEFTVQGRCRVLQDLPDVIGKFIHLRSCRKKHVLKAFDAQSFVLREAKCLLLEFAHEVQEADSVGMGRQTLAGVLWRRQMPLLD